jgi:glutamate-1-semialdehyde 2,1-aminomutase
MRGGIAALKQLTKPGLYDEMTRLARRWVSGLRAELAEAGIPAQINAIGSLLTIFFTPGPVRNYADAKRSDTKRYAMFFREMLDHGIFLAPSQFEAAFVSAAHTSRDIDRTLAAGRESVQAIAARSEVES